VVACSGSLDRHPGWDLGQDPGVGRTMESGCGNPLLAGAGFGGLTLTTGGGGGK